MTAVVGRVGACVTKNSHAKNLLLALVLGNDYQYKLESILRVCPVAFLHQNLPNTKPYPAHFRVITSVPFFICHYSPA